MTCQPASKVVLRVIPTTLLVLAAITACATTSPVSRPPATEAPTPTPATPATSEIRNFVVGTRISFRASEAQIDFVNSHYDYVMTPFLGQEIRDKIQGPQLILYRSIQGTWTDFDQFDWEHINANENMFCHHQGDRILTIWNSWLMDPNDMVDADDPDALNHWINYYAVTAANQVYQYDYDGLFIDSAGHKLGAGAVNGKMPDDYDAERWRQGRTVSLQFIKSHLPDRSVVFNGLHSEGGAEESLAYTDGGMWEVFAFKPSTGAYYGAEKWQDVIELVERNSEDRTIVLVTKEQPGLTDDIQKRTFIVASYLLVSNQNVILSMTDLDYDKFSTIQYYPEYDLNLGEPLGDYAINEQGLFVRQFEAGIVLVNPGESETLTFAPDGDYGRVVPIGGGMVSQDGTWEGSITYEAVGDEIEIPPMSGMVLSKR